MYRYALLGSIHERGKKMLQKYKGRILLTGLVALLFFLAACGNSGGTPPAQTLQQSVTAMSQLKSVHFDMQSTLNMQFPSNNNGNSGGISLNVTGHGDAAAPNQVSATFLMGQNPLLSVVSTGGKVYVQVKNGQWYVTDKSKVPDNVQQFISQHLGDITKAISNAKLTDHGQETVNGESLDHITVALDAQTLQSLSSQLNGMLPTNMQSNQNAITQATLDLWIDQSTSYVHQAKLAIAANVDTSKWPPVNFNGQNIKFPAAVVPTALNAQVNFSKFNQPVTIQAPSGAIPFPQ